MWSRPEQVCLPGLWEGFLPPEASEQTYEVSQWHQEISLHFLWEGIQRHFRSEETHQDTYRFVTYRAFVLFSFLIFVFPSAGVRPYKCNLCEKSFTQRCSLESHCLKVHGVAHQYEYKQRRSKVHRIVFNWEWNLWLTLDSVRFTSVRIVDSPRKSLKFTTFIWRSSIHTLQPFLNSTTRDISSSTTQILPVTS